MLMKEFTANQIAAALVGHPGSAEQELRLLRLFQSEAGETPTLTLPLKGAGNEESRLTRPLWERDLKKAA
jgi:hypothetical protein